MLTQGPPFLSGNWASARTAFGHAEPFETVLSGNREAMARLSMRDLEKILAATLTGMSVEEFNAEAKGSSPLKKNGSDYWPACAERACGPFCRSSCSK